MLFRLRYWGKFGEKNSCYSPNMKDLPCLALKHWWMLILLVKHALRCTNTEKQRKHHSLLRGILREGMTSSASRASLYISHLLYRTWERRRILCFFPHSSSPSLCFLDPSHCIFVSTSIYLALSRGVLQCASSLMGRTCILTAVRKTN